MPKRDPQAKPQVIREPLTAEEITEIRRHQALMRACNEPDLKGELWLATVDERDAEIVALKRSLIRDAGKEAR